MVDVKRSIRKLLFSFEACGKHIIVNKGSIPILAPFRQSHDQVLLRCFEEIVHRNTRERFRPDRAGGREAAVPEGKNRIKVVWFGRPSGFHSDNKKKTTEISKEKPERKENSRKGSKGVPHSKY